MRRALPSEALTPGRVPGPGAPDVEVIRFAQTLNGYEAVGGEASALGAYVGALDSAHPEALTLDDLRILLFARQRAHYHEGGGWGDDDPLMDEMRALTALILDRVTARGQGVGVWQGDITTLDVDAIVNAANPTLAGGGGVDGAIHRAAGLELLEACRAIPELSPGVRCPPGEARITPGYQLPAAHVIHTVGPIWRGGDRDEAVLLAETYLASLHLAQAHALDTVAFPAISTGAYGFPPLEAACIAVEAVRSFQAEHVHPVRVLLVAFDAHAERFLRRAIGEQVDL